MSSDIYTKPDLSTKVRYNRKVEEDGEKWQEREVDIYVSSGSISDEQTGFQDGGPHTHRTSLRGAALCLGVLSLLMTAGIIVLSTLYFSVTFENEQLQTRFNNLSINYTLLQDKLSNVSVEFNQLQDELNKLKIKTKGKFCPEGWTRFGCSCYFKSTERKIWFESQYDCLTRGSRLVMINSKEEQEFVTKLNMNEDSWIGLKSNRTSAVWEWVDGSTLTETFWAEGQSRAPNNWYFAACCDRTGKWTQSISFDNQKKNWICEKKISRSS
uniref:C-type lectin domain-containing protein n=1 Tax=Anabas testudineus TaxID=64144 RepID=A0A7N6C4P0_ANATE